MKIKKPLSLALFSSLILWAYIGFARGVIDVPARLWTTNAAGLAEINEFWVGDPVYLKTADTYGNYPLQRGSYRVYIFEGNIALADGDPIPGGRTPLGLTPLDVTTDSNGRFGPVVGDWATPILIWDHANALGEFTVILDQLTVDGSPAPNVGYWGASQDYRDDLCTAPITPPSFHVISEVGTIVLLASMFGSLGYIAVRKRKSQSHA